MPKAIDAGRLFKARFAEDAGFAMEYVHRELRRVAKSRCHHEPNRLSLRVHGRPGSNRLIAADRRKAGPMTQFPAIVNRLPTVVGATVAAEMPCRHVRG